MLEPTLQLLFFIVFVLVLYATSFLLEIFFFKLTNYWIRIFGRKYLPFFMLLFSVRMSTFIAFASAGLNSGFIKGRKSLRIISLTYSLQSMAFSAFFLLFFNDFIVIEFLGLDFYTSIIVLCMIYYFLATPFLILALASIVSQELNPSLIIVLTLLLIDFSLVLRYRVSNFHYRQLIVRIFFTLYLLVFVLTLVLSFINIKNLFLLYN